MYEFLWLSDSHETSYLQSFQPRYRHINILSNIPHLWHCITLFGVYIQPFPLRARCRSSPLNTQISWTKTFILYKLLLSETWTLDLKCGLIYFLMLIISFDIKMHFQTFIELWQFELLRRFSCSEFVKIYMCNTFMKFKSVIRINVLHIRHKVLYDIV